MKAKKTCTRCKRTKPLKDFYVSQEMNDGRASHCKKCVTDYYCTLEPTVDKKGCPNCLTIKPASDFYRNRRTKSGLAVYCKDCERKRHKNEAS